MIHKSRSILLLLLFPLLSYTQQQGTLRKIIASNLSIEIRQQQLDSFFLTQGNKMSPKVLADCYHDYSVQWCYILRWQREGNIHFSKQAIKYAEKAVQIRRNLDSVDYKQLKKSMYNIGFFNFLKKDYFHAITPFLNLIALGDMDKKTMQSHRMLGNTYANTGDFYKALNSFDRVIQFAEKDTLQRKLLANSYIDRANLYASMGYQEFSKEIQNDLAKANSIIVNTNLNSPARKNQIRQIEGNRLLKTNEFKKAIITFEEIAKGTNTKDSLRLSMVHNSLALSQLKLHNYEDGFLNAKKAIAFNPNYSSPYENLGDYYIRNREFTKGLSHYQKAIDIIAGKKSTTSYERLLSKKEIEIIADKDHLLGHIISKANGWVAYYQHDQNKESLLQALKTFKLADQLVDLIRFESTEYKSKLFWRAKGASLYMKAVEVCYLLHKPEEAYYFMEKNKALLLLEDVTNEQAKENAKLPQTIAKREFALKRSIFLSENSLQNQKSLSKDTLSALKKKVYNAKQIHEQFVDSLSAVFPEYAARKKKITLLPYTAFKEKYVSDQEIVVQYILNNEQGFALFTSNKESMFFKIDAIDQLNTAIFDLQDQLSQPFLKEQDINNYQEVSNWVFQKLIPKDMYEEVKEKNLTIVPDYILQQLSFETLVTDPNTLHYFIKDAEVRYAYSISYLDQNQEIKRNPQKGFIGFAPITFNDAALGDLTFSKAEIAGIQKLYNGSSYLKESATKANFLDQINDYKIIHLSTHADIGDTANPWIAFTDQKVSLNEIYATKNQSDMVVLSACKTSLGELKKGEGVMSLARGFFHSGTKSVVSSLWSSNDKSNQELMVNFYQNLNQGLTKSAALRKTKIAYIDSHSGSEKSPFYWGSLIMIGDNQTLQISNGFPIWVWVGLLVIIVIIGVLIFFKRNS